MSCPSSGVAVISRPAAFDTTKKHHPAIQQHSHSIPSLNPLLILHHNGDSVRTLHNPHGREFHQKLILKQSLHLAHLLRLHVPEIYRRRHIGTLIPGIARLEQRPPLIALCSENCLAVAAQKIRNIGRELAEDALLRVAVTAKFRRRWLHLSERVGDGKSLGATLRAIS